jgi:hypothetical protein
VQEEFLEAQAIEEPLPSEAGEVEATRPLPQRRGKGDVGAWRGEVRNAAIAAAGGLVAGAATVAAARAARAGGRGSARALLLSRRKPDRQVIASRSFLIDVHVLGNR